MPVFSPSRKRSHKDSEDDSSFRFDGSGDYEDDHDEYDDVDEVGHSKEDLISPHLMLEHVEVTDVPLEKLSFFFFKADVSCSAYEGAR
ncbi:hypothetical protein GCK32_020711 [Trichostrongylus colubriformis]|uniref:Uncharacterized protein n=1 Tax=Trichostrongylus colubriformis TaxID=6319 RepID=A0AAN8ETK3_TRICO